MSKDSVADWSTNFQDNLDIGGVPLRGSLMHPSHVPFAFQRLMGQLKVYADTLETVPPGAVATFGRLTAPTGWLKANGALVSRSAYAALFDAIGTTFGAGDGTTTFRLPDMRGEFSRGLDDGRGVDTSRALGSAQAGDMASHSHSGSTSADGSHSHSGSTSTDGAHAHTFTGSLFDSGDPSGSGAAAAPTTLSTSTAGAHAHSLAINAVGNHTHTLSINASGGAETRPRNVALLVCIKF